MTESEGLSLHPIAKLHQ